MNANKQNALLLLFFMVILFNGCKKEDKEPTIRTYEVTSITSTSAKCGGEIASNDDISISERGICWSTTNIPSVSGNKATDGSSGSGSFYANLSGLSGNTVYFVRAYTKGESTIYYGNEVSFTTSEFSDNAFAQEATNIQTTSATLNGVVNANNLTTQVIFEYGTTISYGFNISAVQSPINGNQLINISADISELTVGTNYHFRLKTINSLGGVEFSNDMTFKTLGEAPAASTLPATNIKSNSVMLNGIVNANYLPTTVTFEYGTTTSYGLSVTSTISPITGNTNVNVSASATGLTVGTTYHYRVKSENAFGITYGNDETFLALYAIGEYNLGGIIFHVDNTGLHGLVCAEENQSSGIVWSNGNYIVTGATGVNIGDGQANTLAIIAAQGTGNYAAQLCNDLVLNGYDDWFLPSRNELSAMSSYLAGYYIFSSSEIDSEWVWGFILQGGEQWQPLKLSKDAICGVRAIRAF